MNKGNFFDKRIRPLISHKVFVLIILLTLMVLMFTVWANIKGAVFFKASTLRNILNSIVLSSFLSIGAGCLLISGNVDLSQASLGAFGGMIVAAAIANWHLPIFAAILVALLFCAALGSVNAFMVTRFRFPPFIATLAMASMAKGLMYLFSSIGRDGGVASNVSVNNNAALSFIGKGTIGLVPFGVIVIFVFFVVYGLLIAKSKIGFKIMMMGGNPAAATLAGVNASKITSALYINSASLGCIAGLFSTARLGQGSLLALQTNQFTGITAAILGGISFGGGAGGMGGAFIGLLILNTFQIGMGVVGVNPYWVNVFSGVILLLALAMDFLNQKRVGRVKAV